MQPRLQAGGWLFVRLVLGLAWLRGGWEKLGDPGWTASPVGGAVDGFLQGAIARSTEGPHPEVPHWYHNLIAELFLPNAELFAYLVVAGELLVGLALVFGVFTRLSALLGVTMNVAFLWAGVSSTNPPMLLLGLAIVLVGSRAGAYGVDGWLLPWLSGRAGARLLRAAQLGVGVIGALFAAWLLLIASDWVTWLVGAAVALAVVAAVWLIGARIEPPVHGRARQRQPGR
jgi:thiosulfate dehydrogenase [quinone] large subunit